MTAHIRNQARHLLDAGQAAEALLLLQPLRGGGDREADLMLAEALADMGQGDQALPVFSALLPDSTSWKAAPQAALTWALVCLDQGQPAQAVEVLSVLAQEISAPVIWQSLSTAALAAADYDLAWQANQVLLKETPQDATRWHQAALIRQQEGKLADATVMYQRAVAIAPDQADSWNNLANCLSDRCLMGEADTAFAQAMALMPENADYWCNRGKHNWACGRADEAIHDFTMALQYSGGGHDAARLGLACAQLATRPDIAAWQAFEARFKVTSPLPNIALPLWQGQDLAGQHIVIWGEEGFGDAIQFSRYLPQLAQQAAKVSFCVSAGLHRLLAGQAWLDAVDIRPVDEIPAADCWLPLLSLPVFVDMPKTIACLSVGHNIRPQWPPRRIGLVWQGNPAHNNDHHRSMAVKDMMPLSDMGGMDCISLQMPAPDHLPDGWVNGLAGVSDFADTARVLATLDLVVSVDTAIAHLAGAMGVPVALMAARGADWRWAVTGERTAWYETMRIFRQEMPGDWAMPVNSLIAVIRGGSFLSDSA